MTYSRSVFAATLFGRMLESNLPVKVRAARIGPMVTGEYIGHSPEAARIATTLPLAPHTHTLTDKGWTPCQGCDEERTFNYFMRDGD